MGSVLAASVLSVVTVVSLLGAFEVTPARGAEAALLEDAKDGALDRMSLLRAALVASGVPEAKLAAEEKRTRAALAPAIARARRATTPEARGRMLLRALHETALVRYEANATDVDDVIATGEFNCLSSALLYVIAAQELGLPTTAMVTRRHAFARVTVDGARHDVETTSPAGFGIDRSRALSPELLARIAPPGVDRAALLEDLKAPEELPTLSLLAGVYANRSVPLVNKGELSAAATALDRATQLAAGSARERFASWRASVVNDGARVLIEEGRLDDAQALLELALDGARGDTRAILRTNLGRVHLRKADARAAQQDWRAVVTEIERADGYGVGAEAGNLRGVAQGKLAAESLDDARCAGAPAVAAACLAVLSNALRDKGDIERALQAARKAAALAPRQKDVRAALFSALQERARAKLAQGACADVEVAAREMETLKDVVAEKGWSSASLPGTCFAQRASAAYDARKWDEAARLLHRALVHLPQERAFHQNLARIDLNRAIELSKDARCDDARPLVRGAVRVDASLQQDGARVLEACSNARVVAASKKKAWAEGAVEARRGIFENPASDLLRRNLVVMLTNLAIEHLDARRCDDARAALDEAAAVAPDHTAVRDVKKHAAERCRS